MKLARIILARLLIRAARGLTEIAAHLAGWT